MFNREYQGDIFRLLQAYPLVFGYQFHLDEMHREISDAFQRASHSEPDFYDLGALLRSSEKPKDVIPRKAGWIAQQVLGSADTRAVAINQRIAKRRKVKGKIEPHRAFRSPLVRQLDMLDQVVEPLWAERLQFDISPFAVDGATLDALVVDLPQSTVYTVEAIGAGQLRNLSKRLILGSSEPNLFAPTDRPIGNAIFPMRAARLAVAAGCVVKAACPHLNVVPLAMVVDEVEGSWFFQATRLPAGTAFLSEKNKSQNLCLDDLPLEESILSFVGATGRDDIELGCLGLTPTTKFLQALPVDRTTRPLMFLDRLLAAQVTHTAGLSILNGNLLQRDVQNHFGVAFDRDMRRHDLEACLRNGGWVESPAGNSAEFYITAAGIGLLKLIEQRFVGSSEALSGSAIGLMQRQAQYEIAHRRRMSH